MNFQEQSIQKHKEVQGKLETVSKMKIKNTDDLSVAYSPGIAGPSKVIAQDASAAYDLTIKANTVAVVSDGSAVLGLGNIGPEAALPVMEGKAVLFKEFGGVNAFPICLATQDTEEIIKTVRLIAPGFGGINLEDISAPRCFEIEERLQDLGIPVFHDDQHGTAIVMLAGLMNASRVVGKSMQSMRVVISGAGAAGTAIAKLLCCMWKEDNVCVGVKDVIVCDSRGMLSTDRDDLNDAKLALAKMSNREGRSGSLADAVVGADLFIGVSIGGLLTAEMVQTMAKDPIVFAMANPVPEIMPDVAKQAGVSVMATGRSDFPNQVNNVLVFPGIFKGALSVRATRVTEKMKLVAAQTLAGLVDEPTAEKIIPAPLTPGVADAIAQSVAQAWESAK